MSTNTKNPETNKTSKQDEPQSPPPSFLDAYAMHIFLTLMGIGLVAVVIAFMRR